MPGLEELSFDLFERDLVFPPLLVGRGEFHRGYHGGVEDRRDQTECLRGVRAVPGDGVFNDPDGDMRGIAGIGDCGGWYLIAIASGSFR